jgi:signal transduction histidine kinase
MSTLEGPIPERPVDREGGLRQFEELLSTLGHDLRSPLSAVHLNIEAALRRLPPGAASGNEIRASLQRAREIVKQTVGLIEGLLREARERETPEIERRRVGTTADEPEIVELRDVIHECVALHGAALHSASCSVTIRCDGALSGRWSRSALHQILSNLIVNATKYAPGKPIEVLVTRAGKTVVLAVSDQGPGFSIEEQKRVFERFQQEPRAGDRDGFGLGLWIVRRAVDRLKGTVRLMSTPGEGAMFVIEFPCE